MTLTRKHQKPSVDSRISHLEVQHSETRWELQQTVMAYGSEMDPELKARLQVIIERLRTREEAVRRIYKGDPPAEMKTERFAKIKALMEASRFEAHLATAGPRSPLAEER